MAGGAWERRVAKLMEAQFYMSELDRRHDSWISLRDLILEIVVIVLIGGEIWLAWKQGKDEDTLMDKQNAVLANLQTSSSATANTLGKLETTTEVMNGAIQRQLGILSQVSLAITFDIGQRRINITNNGNQNLELWGNRLADQKPTIDNEPRIIPRGGYYYLLAGNFYKEATEKLKDKPESFIPFEVYLKDDTGSEFVAKSQFLAQWDGGVLQLHSQTTSIEKRRWGKRLP